MNEFEFELNYSGIGELLKSNQMKEVCIAKAEEIKQRCGDGYETDSYTGKNRVNAMVYTESWKARKDNRDNNTLLRNMH